MFLDVLPPAAGVGSLAYIWGSDSESLTAIGAYAVKDESTGDPTICISARRKAIVRNAFIVMTEFGCLLGADYRFDPVVWRAVATARVPMTMWRQVHRRTVRGWVPVSSHMARSRDAIVNLTWAGFGDPVPYATLDPPSADTAEVSQLYWGRASVSPGRARAGLGKVAFVTGFIRFGGFNEVVRPQGGVVLWGVPGAF